MPQESQWPETDSERTDTLSPVPPEGAEHTAAANGEPEPGHKPGGRRKLRRAGIITGATVAALALLYGVDLLISHGNVPRGVQVAGVTVGGMDRDQAREVLHERLEPRLTEPVQVRAGDVRTTLDPSSSGLSLDWEVTVREAGDQPLNPFTRVSSFFTTREVGVVTDTEPNQLETSMAALNKKVSHEPVEGTIEFDGAEPQAVMPQQGQQLDTEAATDLVLDQWIAGHPLQLPVSVTPVKTDEDAVRTALEQVAEPAVSGPVTVHGEGKDATLEPAEIAAGLSFSPTDDGALEPKIDRSTIVEGIDLGSTEDAPQDASIVFSGGEPTVQPSEDGTRIKWKKTLKPLLDVLGKTEQREIDAVYEDKSAELTTKEAQNLGINEVIGEFTTTDFAQDSGVNIRKVAQEVDGAVIKPGDTFSLNGYTGQRSKAQGYIPAGIIQNGVPAEGVGGGISQFATTLYNASYFAGMRDVEHQEHSYYISRYPQAREATVFQRPDGTSVIDVKFANDYDTGVAIQTIWTPSSITVKLWGTKHVDVESNTGDRHNYTSPGVRHVSDQECVPTEGQRGFTTSDTRIVRDADSGDVISKKTNKVVYDSVPKVICEDD